MIETNHPLLIFPEPTRVERAARSGRGGKIKTPDASQQAERLAPQFQRLQEALEQKRVALQDNTLGIQPEQVLVLEIVGSINDFIKTVKRIDGLEWLGEFEHDRIDPGYGFEDEKDPQKRLNGQLFLVMTDQQALKDMENYFTQWKENPDVSLPYGLAKLRHAFTHLHTIRPWGVEDRIQETGIWEDWQERLQYEQENVLFEAELWFRENENRRQQAESHLRSIITSLDGEVIQQCVIPEISYHGILGRIPSENANEIINQQEVKLLECEGIMHLRPVGQCSIRIPDDVTDTEPMEQEPQSDIPQGDPIVALFDGLPLTGHQKLDGRIFVDDPDGYESEYLARERFHGTTMASLICHGDLNERGNAIGRPLYARPIMKPQRGFDNQFYETIPGDVLPTDFMHRIVRRLYETENGEPPVAPSIRVINLSIGDPARPLSREMSSWARVLDWLSWKYNVLFIVSAGNHTQDLELNIPRSDLSSLTDKERERAVIEAVDFDTRNRRLLSPSEMLNGVTVGAVHEDASSSSPPGNLLDPFYQSGQPSVISAHGPGYRRAIKPDLLLPGGRQFVTEKLGNNHNNSILEMFKLPSAPGQCVAAPGEQGELNHSCYTRGTSNAAALASRGAMLLYDIIEQLRREHGQRLASEYDAVLLKALLVHGANWSNSWDLYKQILRNNQNSRVFKEYIGRLLGYGSANINKVMACTDQRATVLGVGALEDKEGNEFILPLPPSLSSVTYNRRLTITLAWLTPINSSRQNYRVAHLWFNPK